MNKLDKDRMDACYQKIDFLLSEKKDLIPNQITATEILAIRKRLYNKFGKHRDGTKILFNKKYYRQCWVTNSLQGASIHKGLPRMIHDVSHKIDRIKNRRYVDNYKNHNLYQAQLELDMIEWALSKPEFWNGFYLPKPKQKPTNIDKIENLKLLVKKWKTKEMRALTYIKKYKKQLSRLEKQQ